jgi:alpha-galactosidase
MCSALCINWAHSGDGPCERLPENFPFAWAKAALDQYLELRQYYYGDFYPLTGYSQATDAWMAYQLDLPEQGEGLVVVLKRPLSPFTDAAFPLKALQPEARYELLNLDSNEKKLGGGAQLLERGLELRLVEKPATALFRYRRI